jgi:acyl carrier protein
MDAQFVISTIANILQVPLSSINNSTSEFDFDEWDSMANLVIFTSLNQSAGVPINIEAYLNCETVGDIIALFVNSRQ